MPDVSFFADAQDAKLLVEWLNTDPEVAFIIADGPLDPGDAYYEHLAAQMRDRPEATLYPSSSLTFYPPLGRPASGYQQRWKAVAKVAELKDGTHCLWHLPAGPLTLLTADGADQVVPSPFEGWTEPGAETPYFGHENTAVLRLDLWTRHRPYSEAEKGSLSVLNAFWDDDEDMLVVSDCHWIGDHYQRAPEATRRWWNRLEAWVAENAARIGHFTGEDEDTGEETSWGFSAFPSALQKLKSGMAYYARNWKLDEGIQTASGPGRGDT